MNEAHTTKQVLNVQPMGTGRNGRPNLRCIDSLEKDLLVLRTRNWRTLAGRRLAGKRLLEKAKTHRGSSIHEACLDMLHEYYEHLPLKIFKTTALDVSNRAVTSYFVRIFS
ncbi:hypothetical protein TNCV_2726921 [Trichonephila clavipes]|nr:hypothetical protein TNCV_2726921 [Trichonephila clavipes]